MSEQQDPKSEKPKEITEERGLGGMGSDGDATSPYETTASSEQRREIDFLRASDVMGAEGWEGGEPRLDSEDDTKGPRRSLKGNAGLGPKGYRRSDESIKEDVCDRLTQDPVIDATDVEVMVKDGEVTLTGTVAGRIERSRAEDIIAEVRGLKNIKNQITVVSPVPWPRDDDSARSNAGAP